MPYDIVCFSHLRWSFVYQRPQHLLSRFGRFQRVFFIEEPLFDSSWPHNEINQDKESGVYVVTPHLQKMQSDIQIVNGQRRLLDNLFYSKYINDYIFWYYSPMALPYSNHFFQRLTIYDCMDELSAFKFASPELKENEDKLFKLADLVFTGGHHLYEAKKYKHHNIYPVPSSIDKEHFAKAREIKTDPPGQENIPHPRLGFYGVIDERFSLELLEDMAVKKPEWNFILIGPLAKIDRKVLPTRPNIYYLGPKDYKLLPAYLSGWDVAIMPFALNESTKYISPTKTPEFLAGGKPVVSTSIRDVVMPYGEQGLVHIADTSDAFIETAKKILSEPDNSEWLLRVDNFLDTISWDDTWEFMRNRIEESIENKNVNNLKTKQVYV